MNKKEFTLFDLLFTMVSGLFFSFILFVLFVLVTAVSWHELWQQLSYPTIFSAIWISLQTSLAVVFLTFFLGLHVACMLDLKSFHGKMILDTFVDLSITELFINFVEKNIIMIYL